MKQRQVRNEASHNAANEFVKRHQNESKKMSGKLPNMEEKYMEFDAEMTNTGEKAEMFGRELTRGLDKEAFPVR